MTKKAWRFNNIRVNKKKEPIDLMSVKIDQIVVSDKFNNNNNNNNNNNGPKYSIGHQEGEIVKPLCIIEWIHKILWIPRYEHTLFN